MILLAQRLLSRTLVLWFALAQLFGGVGCTPAPRPFMGQPTVAALIERLSNEATPAGRTALARAWLAETSGRPWPPYEDGQVHFFLWDEERQQRAVPGVALAARGWKAQALPLLPLAGTPLFHASLTVDPLADFVYWIVAGGEWSRDPRNPLTAPDPLQQLASRVDLAGRGRPAWASRPPFMLRGRFEKRYLAGGWFVGRPAWVYHSPASASNRRGWKVGETSRPTHVDGLLVIGMASDPSDQVLLANCLDRAFLGSEARLAVVCLETRPADAPLGGWGFAEIATREVTSLVASLGGSGSNLPLAVAATGMEASHLLQALLRGGAIAQRVWCLAPQRERHGPFLEYSVRQPLPQFDGLRLQLAGLDSEGDFWARLRERMGERGVQFEPENPVLLELASKDADRRRTAVYALVRDWL